MQAISLFSPGTSEEPQHTHEHTQPAVSPLTRACVFSSTDRPGVTHHSVIDRNQETLALTLKTYIEAKRSEPSKQ